MALIAGKTNRYGRLSAKRLNSARDFLREIASKPGSSACERVSAEMSNRSSDNCGTNPEELFAGAI
jgi:hypothetical protein